MNTSINSTWTTYDDLMFLNAVANDIVGRWPEMAGMIPGKTADEVKAYYEAAEHYLLEIEAGRVELPDYLDDDELNVKVKKEAESIVNSDSGSKPREKERKKANPWSVEEHRRFLQGLEIYGKGDWRNISRMMVVTRTATQVASHAQKYFLRQAPPKEGNNNNKKRKKKRHSIHDITTADAAAQPTSLPAPTTSSPADFNGGQFYGSQERGAQSSVTLWPSIPDISTTDTDTTMVVHAQPMSSTPPAASFYDSKGKGVLAEATTSPAPFYDGQYYGGQGGGAQPPVTLPPDDFYGSQERGAQSLVTLWPNIQDIATIDTTMVVHAQQMSSTPPTPSFYDSKGKGMLAEATTSSPHYFYGGQGGGAQLPVTRPPDDFYGGHGGGALQPLSSLYDGQGGALSGYEFNFSDSYYHEL